MPKPQPEKEVEKIIRVGVTGGRDFHDKAFVYKTLDRLFFLLTDTKRKMILIHGAAKGADTLAGQWAAYREVEQEPHPADWKKDGRAAGPIRNQEMLNSGIDFLVAFPGGRGTDHMKTICKKKNVRVWEPEYNEPSS